MTHTRAARFPLPMYVDAPKGGLGFGCKAKSATDRRANLWASISSIRLTRQIKAELITGVGAVECSICGATYWEDWGFTCAISRSGTLWGATRGDKAAGLPLMQFESVPRWEYVAACGGTLRSSGTSRTNFLNTFAPEFSQDLDCEIIRPWPVAGVGDSELMVTRSLYGHASPAEFLST